MRLVENRVRRWTINIAVNRIPDIVNVHFDAGMPEAVWRCVVVAAGGRRCGGGLAAAVRWVVVVYVVVISIGTRCAGRRGSKTIGRASAVPNPQSGYPWRQLGLSSQLSSY